VLEKQLETSQADLVRVRADTTAAAHSAGLQRMIEDQRESSSVLSAEKEVLASEVQSLRARNEKLAKSLSSEKARTVVQRQECERMHKEIERLQTALTQYPKEFARRATKRLLRLSTTLMQTLDSLESSFARGFDKLGIQIGNLVVSSARLSLLTVFHGPSNDPGSDSVDFLAQIAQGIKSIERLSQVYGSSSTLRMGADFE
jgi:predicted RNase H-like nuclease (RuvC/YqgF family)